MLCWGSTPHIVPHAQPTDTNAFLTKQNTQPTIPSAGWAAAEKLERGWPCGTVPALLVSPSAHPPMPQGDVMDLSEAVLGEHGADHEGDL